MSTPTFAATANFPNGLVPDAGANVDPLNVLITGASRGIGLQLATQYARANPNNRVFAAVRDVTAPTVTALTAAYPNVIAVPLDVSQEQSVRASLKHVTAVTDHLDVLINNAGISRPTPLLEITREEVLEVFTVNTASVLTVIQTYIALLQNGSRRVGSPGPAKVVNISTVLASHQHAAAIGILKTSYGMSKAALNYLTTACKHTFPDVVFLAVHPGWVLTDLTRGSKAPVTVENSASGIRYITTTRGLTNSGEFIDNISGNIIPY